MTIQELVIQQKHERMLKQRRALIARLKVLIAEESAPIRVWNEKAHKIGPGNHGTTPGFVTLAK